MIHILESLDEPAVAVYSSLTEAQLRNRLHPEDGIFIAESPKVIRVAIEHGYKPLSMLCEEKHITGDAAEIIALCPEMPIYSGSRELLAQLTGYTLTRGVLCAMRRPLLPSVEELCSKASRIAVLDGVVDATNTGAIFRSAAALGIDAVILTPSTSDPLNRRSVRVSMGTVFTVPWTYLPSESYAPLRECGFKTVALALTDRSVSIDDPVLAKEPKLALVLGSEGHGLAKESIHTSDYTARIPMSRGVDSLNVGAAAAIAFWQLRK